MYWKKNLKITLVFLRQSASWEAVRHALNSFITTVVCWGECVKCLMSIRCHQYSKQLGLSSRKKLHIKWVDGFLHWKGTWKDLNLLTLSTAVYNLIMRPWIDISELEIKFSLSNPLVLPKPYLKASIGVYITVSKGCFFWPRVARDYNYTHWRITDTLILECLDVKISESPQQLTLSFHAMKHKQFTVSSNIMIILGSSIPGKGVWCPLAVDAKDRMVQTILMHN